MTRSDGSSLQILDFKQVGSDLFRLVVRLLFFYNYSGLSGKRNSETEKISRNLILAKTEY